MRGKKGFRQTRNRDLRVAVAGVDADTFDVLVNTATPTGLNGTNPATIFSGFQNLALPQNPATANTPVIRLAHSGDRFALLSYSADTPGNTPTTSQILISANAVKWRTRTLPTRDTPDAAKHAWAEVFGSNGRFIVSHGQYPDIAFSDDGRNWTLLQNVFAVNGFQQNGIAYGGSNVLLAAADDAKVIYRSEDNGLSWAQIAANVTITESTAAIKTKALDTVLALTYGVDGSSRVFFMLAKRNDIARYRYILTSSDGVTWTQRLRVDLGTAGTPQEPIMVSSPTRTIVLFNNLSTATTLITTTSASIWQQLTNTPGANWRTVIYDGGKFIAVGEPFSSSAGPIVMTLDPAILSWNVKLTGTQKLRDVAVGQTAQLQPDASVTLLLRMAGEPASTTFIDSSPFPKTVVANNVSLSNDVTKWPETNSALFYGNDQYLAIAGNDNLAVNDGDFTIEAWVWLYYYTDAPFWDANPVNADGYRSNSFVWYMNNSGSLRVYRQGGDILATASAAIPLQTWSHIALVRRDSKTTIYVDGEAKSSTYISFNDINAVNGAIIGRFCDNSYSGLNGYIGEFRLTKGIAQYSGNSFPVPEAPLLNYSPLGVPTTLTTMSGNNAVALAWTQPAATGGENIRDYVAQYSADLGNTWTTIPDAVSTSTTIVATNLTNGSNYMFRVAAVTDDGTGPYSPPSAIIQPGGDTNFQNVSLLLHFDNMPITDNSGYGFVPLQSAFTTTEAKFGDGCGVFTAVDTFVDSGYGYYDIATTYQFIKFADQPAFNLAGGDWTVEMWLWPTGNYNGTNTIIAKRDDGTEWQLYLRPNDGGLSYYNGSNYETNATPPANRWSHVAAVRQNGTLSLYLNGARVLTTSAEANAGSNPVYIGAYSTEQFFGRIDELRITKGIARYSGSVFDPPGAPFPDNGPLTEPLNFNVTNCPDSTILSWQMPRALGYSTIQDYSVQYSADSGATWTNITHTPDPFRTGINVTNLTVGNSYRFRVAVITENETGPYAVTPTNISYGEDPQMTSTALLLRFDETTEIFTNVGGLPDPATWVFDPVTNTGHYYLTATGDVTHSATKVKWGSRSAFFNGGYLSAVNFYGFGFSVEDFTIEFWAYPTDDSTCCGAFISVGYYYSGLLLRRGTNPDSLYINGAWRNWNPQANVPINRWTHVALVRKSGVISIYAAGKRVLEWSNPADLGYAQPIRIGAAMHAPWETYRGYLDEFRITYNYARYMGDEIIVPPCSFPSWDQ